MKCGGFLLPFKDEKISFGTWLKYYWLSAGFIYWSYFGAGIHFFQVHSLSVFMTSLNLPMKFSGLIELTNYQKKVYSFVHLDDSWTELINDYIIFYFFLTLVKTAWQEKEELGEKISCIFQLSKMVRIFGQKKKKITKT